VAYVWGSQYVWSARPRRARPPRRIRERAVEACRAGRIEVRAVAALSGADPRATERELDEVGIRPPQAPCRQGVSTYEPSSSGATSRA
jgi:hypothetical protein